MCGVVGVESGTLDVIDSGVIRSLSTGDLRVSPPPVDPVEPLAEAVVDADPPVDASKPLLLLNGGDVDLGYVWSPLCVWGKSINGQLFVSGCCVCILETKELLGKQPDRGEGLLGEGGRQNMVKSALEQE